MKIKRLEHYVKGSSYGLSCAVLIAASLGLGLAWIIGTVMR